MNLGNKSSKAMHVMGNKPSYVPQSIGNRFQNSNRNPASNVKKVDRSEGMNNEYNSKEVDREPKLGGYKAPQVHKPDIEKHIKSKDGFNSKFV